MPSPLDNPSLCGPRQWLSDLSRSFLPRPSSVASPSLSSSSFRAPQSFVVFAAGALSVGAAASVCSTFTTEIRPQAWWESLQEALPLRLPGLALPGLEQPTSCPAGPSDAFGLGHSPRLADEALLEPFSLSPLDAPCLEDIFQGVPSLEAEPGGAAVACLTSSLTSLGRVEDGSVEEPTTRARFPLLLCQEPQPPRTPVRLGAKAFSGDAKQGQISGTGPSVAQPGSAACRQQQKERQALLLSWGRQGVWQQKAPQSAMEGTDVVSPGPPLVEGGSQRGAVVDGPGLSQQTLRDTAASGLESEATQSTHSQDPSSMTPSSACHVLAGVGVQGKTIARVKTVRIYAFGVYVHPQRLKSELAEKFKSVPPHELKDREEFYDELLSREVGMTVRLVVHYRGLTMEMVRKALNKSLCNRLTKFTGSPKDQGLDEFNFYLSQPRAMARGTTIDFSWLPGGRLLTTIDGQPLQPIQSANLCRAFFDLYVGNPPVCQVAKHKIGASIARILVEC